MTDSPLAVTDSWEVSTAALFPDLAREPSAFRPALTEAANGDLVVAFNLGSDGHPGGRLRLTRSADRGRTWAPSSVLAARSAFGPDGAISSQRGLTTLRDGTLLLPFNDSVNLSEFNNRRSTLQVAHSDDHGHTWTGLQTPVTLPREMREVWVGGSKIIELGEGELLLPVWGVDRLSRQWQTDPERCHTGVLFSGDAGRTWSDYRRIFTDPHNPPQYPPLWWTRYPSGANEVSIIRLNTGRLTAAARFATGLGSCRSQLFLSTSDDNGRSWSVPVPSATRAETHSWHEPRTTGRSFLIMGCRELDETDTRTGRSCVSVSFDHGRSWQGKTYLRYPRGPVNSWRGSGEVAFVQYDDHTLLALFQAAVDDEPYRLIANLIDYRAIAAVSSGWAPPADPVIYVERSDRRLWPWPHATTRVVAPVTTTLRELVTDAAPKILLNVDQHLTVSTRSRPDRLLPLESTLAEAKLESGEALVVSGESGPADRMIGFTELDLHPATRAVTSWGVAGAQAPLALDYRARSIGVRTGPATGLIIDAVELRGLETTSRLTEEAFRLWASTDNAHYTELRGWACSCRRDGGSLVFRFADIDSPLPYLKISQCYTDTSSTFTLERPGRDIGVALRRDSAGA